MVATVFKRCHRQETCRDVFRIRRLLYQDHIEQFNINSGKPGGTAQMRMRKSRIVAVLFKCENRTSSG